MWTSLRRITFVLSMVAILMAIAEHYHAQRHETSQQIPKLPENYTAVLEKKGISSKILRETTQANLAGWMKDSAIGARVTRLAGLRAGLRPDSLPGVKFVKLEEVRRMSFGPKASGLYLVDVDFVPRDLAVALKFYRYTLKPDGTLLDSNNEPIVALVTSEVYLMQKTEPTKDAPSADGLSLFRMLDSFSNKLVPTVYAANPFPWHCYSFTPWAVYHSGFHRWYDARTWAAAYGPDSSGGCSGGSPLTHIDYIQSRAAVGGGGDEDHCYNCESEYSRDVWDVGYWWPAHGIPTTYHSGVWADGWYSFSRTAYLTW